MHGHLAARLDPLGSEPTGDPALDETRLDPPLTPELQARIPARLLRLYVPGETLLEALPRLREVYMRLDRVRDRAHLRSRRARLAAAGDRVRPLPRGRSSAGRAAARCCGGSAQVEGFEQYLRKSFLGQKQFSLEGLDVLVPMLDETIELAAAGGAHEVVIGMAHRGRLNALAHTVGRPYESILREFEGERTYRRASSSDPEGGTRRRQVPPRGVRHARDRRPARSRSRSRRTRAISRPSTRWSRAGRAPSRPTAQAGRAARPDGRAAGADPRRRGVPGPGRRRRDAQPLEPRRATRRAARCT